MAGQTSEERAKLLAAYDLAQHLPPELVKIAQELRSLLDEYSATALSLGLLGGSAKAYVQTAWKPGNGRV